MSKRSREREDDRALVRDALRALRDTGRAPAPEAAAQALLEALRLDYSDSRAGRCRRGRGRPPERRRADPRPGRGQNRYDSETRKLRFSPGWTWVSATPSGGSPGSRDV